MYAEGNALIMLCISFFPAKRALYQANQHHVHFIVTLERNTLWAWNQVCLTGAPQLMQHNSWLQ